MAGVIDQRLEQLERRDGELEASVAKLQRVAEHLNEAVAEFSGAVETIKNIDRRLTTLERNFQERQTIIRFIESLNGWALGLIKLASALGLGAYLSHLWSKPS